MTKAVERNLVRHGIERIRGRARFLPGRRVEVEKRGGERVVLEADVVLLASGSRPRHPPGIPMDDPDVHDSESILDDRRRAGVDPRHRRRLRRLRVRVDLRRARRAGDRRGRRHPPAPGARRRDGAGPRRVLQLHGDPRDADGLRVRRPREADALEARLADGRTLRAQKILVAAGRRPQIEGLGLAEAGVEIDSAGWVRVDDRYATTAPGVFAAGDVIGPLGLASMAMEQARVAVCHAFGFEYKKEADRFRPSYVFSIPEAAWVGLTEEQARASGIDYEVGRSSFGTNAKAQISRIPGRPREARVPGARQGAPRRPHRRRAGQRARPHRAVRDARGRHDRPLHRRDVRRPHPERGIQVRRLRRADAPRTPRGIEDGRLRSHGSPRDSGATASPPRECSPSGFRRDREPLTAWRSRCILWVTHFSERIQTPSQFSGRDWADSSGMRSRKTRAGPSSGASSRQLRNAATASVQACRR